VLLRVDRLQALDRRLDQCLPGVVLLPADELERAIAGVVGGAAVLEIVQVVTDQMRVDAVVLEDFRHRIVERLERAPAAVHEIEPAGMQIAPRRHARQAADIVGVERDRALREAVEVGRRDRAPVRTDREPVEGIEQDEHDLHVTRARLPIVRCGDGRRIPHVRAKRMIDQWADSVQYYCG
jgi:hypothetical protein